MGRENNENTKQRGNAQVNSAAIAETGPGEAFLCP